MIKIQVPEKLGGKRADAVVFELFPDTPKGIFYKAFKKKDVRVNGTRVREQDRVNAGDTLQMYIPEAGVTAATEKEIEIPFKVVYQQHGILVVEKPQAVLVHEDQQGTEAHLSEAVRNTVPENETEPGGPWLCHRIDRNTGGLLIFALTQTVRQEIIRLMDEGKIRKTYTCYVWGKPSPASGVFRAYMTKDAGNSHVRMRSSPAKGALTCITEYHTLETRGDISKLEVDLHTGRTHQIRAHLAFLGHPLVGDGKYGDTSRNRSSGADMQLLWASKLSFSEDIQGKLSPVAGLVLVSQPDFRFRNKKKAGVWFF